MFPHTDAWRSGDNLAIRQPERLACKTWDISEKDKIQHRQYSLPTEKNVTIMPFFLGGGEHLRPVKIISLKLSQVNHRWG